MDRKSLCLSIIQESLNTGTPVGTLCQKKNLSKFYVKDCIKDLRNKKKKTEQDEHLIELYNEYSVKYKGSPKDNVGRIKNIATNIDQVQEEKMEFSEKFSNPLSEYDTLTDEEKEMLTYDADADEKYDERSIGCGLREKLDDLVIDTATGQPLILPNGETLPKITRYYYKVLIRDEHPLEGHFTREEMMRVHRLYSSLDGAGLTIRAVSREFPYLTYRDFKRILRAFNITKQSTPFPVHIIEETSKDKIVELVFRGKENDILKKMDLERAKHIEKILIETQRELISFKRGKQDMKDIFSSLNIPEIEPFTIVKKDVKTERGMFVYLSDQHVGANTEDDSIYQNAYTAEVFESRMNKVLNRIHASYKIYGRFDKLFILNMGDCIDGFNGQTTRGGHGLPQNLNNKEQFSVYLTVMLKFFDSLHKLNVANSIEFISVGDSNHGGDVEWMVNTAIAVAAETRYPDMKTRVFDKFIEHFSYGNHTFIVTHGKDKADMKFGFPLVLDRKAEVYIDDYINTNRITTPTINFLKGDLHQSAIQFGKRFRYKNVPSLYGASKWIHTNFGTNMAAVDYEIIEKDVDTYEAIVEGKIFF